jgi:hypothetical protein
LSTKPSADNSLVALDQRAVTHSVAFGVGCSVAAERISMAPFTCASVAEQELAGYA